MRFGVLLLSAAMIGGVAAPAFAQQQPPLPPFALDARVFTARTGQDQTTATDLGIPTSGLASGLKGFVLGGTIYPVRGRSKALGVGVEGVFGRGLTTIASTYVSGFDAQVSANFGHRDGWSYVSAGAGPMRINSFLGAQPFALPPGHLTLNFGGGARWFNWEHLAIGFDVRFFLTQANESREPLYAGRGTKRVMFISLGFSIK